MLDGTTHNTNEIDKLSAGVTSLATGSSNTKVEEDTHYEPHSN